MFTLITDRTKYYRVKRGQSASSVESVLLTPAGEVFDGAIIAVCPKPLKIYGVKPGDTYRSLAEKFGCAEEELKTLNKNAPLYPTFKLFVPCK